MTNLERESQARHVQKNVSDRGKEIEITSGDMLVCPTEKRISRDLNRSCGAEWETGSFVQRVVRRT